MAQYYYGGQAVVEGVMMRGRHLVDVAVRRSDGEIIHHSEDLPQTLYRSPVARLPLVRGLVVLWEMLILGTRMLLWAANLQVEQEIQEEIPAYLVPVMMFISLGLAVGLFFLAPLILVNRIPTGHDTILKNAIEGLIRLGLLVAYLLALGRVSSLKRVFQYHGAEHKAINAFESGAPLTPESVQRFSLRHIRCGTAFLLWVMVISVVVFSVLGRGNVVWTISSRIVLIPLIAAVSYEMLRLGARFYNVAVVRWIMTPGLWLQALTTRQPDDSQVECAIAALERVLAADGEPLVALPPAAPAIAEAAAG